MIFFNKISMQEKVDFANNLAVMLKSGIAIDEAFVFLSEQTKTKVFRKVILRIKNNIERGTSLTEAFIKEKKFFGNIFISLIKTGEASGTLEKNLTFLADWLEQNNDLRREIKSATFYPKFIFSVTFLLGLNL